MLSGRKQIANEMLDLHAQLQQAQEELRAAKRALTKPGWARDLERDEAIERAERAEEKYDLALNACHIGLALNDEYRERAERAERRLKWHHASHPLPKRPPQPAILGDQFDPDLCRFCQQADYETLAQREKAQ